MKNITMASLLNVKTLSLDFLKKFCSCVCIHSVLLSVVFLLPPDGTDKRKGKADS